MKKVLFTFAVLLACNCTFGQNLRKGHLLGLHTITVVKLTSTSTMDDFKNFFLNSVIPTYEKAFQGAKGYLVKGVRGENNNSLALLWVFENEQARDRYFNADGTTTDAGKAAMQKLAGLEKEMERIGTYESKYTDWVVQ